LQPEVLPLASPTLACDLASFINQRRVASNIHKAVPQQPILHRIYHSPFTAHYTLVSELSWPIVICKLSSEAQALPCHGTFRTFSGHPPPLCSARARSIHPLQRASVQLTCNRSRPPALCSSALEFDVRLCLWFSFHGQLFTQPDQRP